jgi:putative nucleotidyltransferase with HDIG domain
LRLSDPTLLRATDGEAMFNSLRKSARLSQWNGRRHSSRQQEPVLPRLKKWPVQLRLATALATTLLVTMMAFWWGPPLPYRVGEICRAGVRARTSFDVINQPQTERRRDEAVQRANGSGHADPRSVEEARFAVPPVVDKYPAGALLLQRGQPITEAEMPLLEEEHRSYLQSMTAGDRAGRGVALFLVMGLLSALVVLYSIRFQPTLAQSVTKIGGICALVVITFALALILNEAPWHAALLPLTLTAMILTIAYNPQFALLLSFSLSFAATVALNTDLEHLLIHMGGLATAVLLLRNVSSRSRLVQVGLGAGLACAVLTLATGLLSGQTWVFITGEAARHFAGTSLAGFLLTGMLPVVERCFGILTDVSLLQLADGSHALLQELIRRAPGTYTHSMAVATLAEAAAEVIGANTLLVRVGSYFHDVGKMLKPSYFIENQAGENLHDALEPALSTLVIIGHIKDGRALARQYNLPRPIIDAIQQHHGTTLVEYFYREALRLQEGNGNATVNFEAAFRYPGPKPQNRENGVLMLADSSESASRALKEPTPSSLRKLVHDLLMKRLLDGQFEESGLTLTELHLIEESLSKSLIALYHGRIKYPDETSPISRRAA